MTDRPHAMPRDADEPALSDVLDALSVLRAPKTQTEYDLHALVAEALLRAGLPCRHETPVGPRRRVDFLCGGVAVEVKRGRPAPAPLLRQLAAYADSPLVRALVLVAERAPALPASVRDKPLRVVSLSRLWGVAI